MGRENADQQRYTCCGKCYGEWPGIGSWRVKRGRPDLCETVVILKIVLQFCEVESNL